MTGDEQAGASGPARSIRVECLACGRTSALSEPAGSQASLVQITRRLRCSACGSRAVKAARIDTPRDVARLLRSRINSGRA